MKPRSCRFALSLSLSRDARRVSRESSAKRGLFCFMYFNKRREPSPALFFAVSFTVRPRESSPRRSSAASRPSRSSSAETAAPQTAPAPSACSAATPSSSPTRPRPSQLATTIRRSRRPAPHSPEYLNSPKLPSNIGKQRHDPNSKLPKGPGTTS